MSKNLKYRGTEKFWKWSGKDTCTFFWFGSVLSISYGSEIWYYLHCSSNIKIGLNSLWFLLCLNTGTCPSAGLLICCLRQYLSSWHKNHDKLRWTRHQVHFSSTAAKFTGTSSTLVHVAKDRDGHAWAVVCSVLAALPLGHTVGKSTKITNLLVC